MPGDTAEITMRVKNTGSAAGDEVIQLYIQDTKSTIDRPVKELKGFTRVRLQPGESKNISLKLDTAAFSFYDVKRKSWIVEKGRFKIMLGSSSRDIRLEGNIELK
jgi:beta-glucosidase